MSVDHTLPCGTEIQGYRIDRVIGSGGFGITYRATDLRLGVHVAIKEYFPVQLARRSDDCSVISRSDGNHKSLYSWGLEKFKCEADSLARLRHTHIVGVKYLFEGNNTSYMVLDYVEGGSFKDWLKANKAPSQSQLEGIAYPLLDALQSMHQKGLLHRDIAPKNIMLTPSLKPVLIDFGAVRLLVAQHSQTVANILTPGYAPCEQYSNRGQGPWTDIYAFAASLYSAIASAPPPDGLERAVQDRYIPAIEVGRGLYSEPFLNAIDWGLRPLPMHRPQSVDQWRQSLRLT